MCTLALNVGAFALCAGRGAANAPVAGSAAVQLLECEECHCCCIGGSVAMAVEKVGGLRGLSVWAYAW